MPVITDKNKRRQDRRKAVLPVRVRGNDVFGKSFEELAHTLDVTPTGARLGGIRRQVNTLEQLTVLYRQRKIEFKVIWTKKLDKASEYQVGLQAMTTEQEAWGLNLSDFAVLGAPRPVQSAAAAVAEPSGVA